MKKTMFLLSMLFLATGLMAQSVIWVERAHQDASFVDMLKGEGYTVTVKEGADYTSPLTQDQLDEFNSADLVVVSRANYSSNFSDSVGWNSLTTPIILMSPYIARSSQFKWMEYSGKPAVKESVLKLENPNHPIFEGVTMDVDSNVVVYDTTIGGGYTTFADVPDVGNGQLLATIKGSGVSAIVYFEAGVKYHNLTNLVSGGKRLFFPATPDDEKDGYLATDWGKKNLTSDGDKMFLNAVRYMAPRLLVHYTYDDITAGVVADASINGLDGVLTGGTVVPGIFGDAIRFENTPTKQEYLKMPDTTLFSRNEYTFATWVKSPDLANDSTYPAIFMHDVYGTYGVHFKATPWQSLLMHLPGRDGTKVWGDNQFEPLDGWHHVALVSTNNSITLYIDGTLDINQDAVPAFIDEITVKMTTIGGSDDNSDAEIGGILVIDDSRYYNYALTADEIAAIATPPVARFDLTLSAGDNGSVSNSPIGTSFDDGTSVTITATADDGYEFSGWTGDTESTVSPLIIAMDSNITIAASFVKSKYILKTLVLGSGSISASPVADGYMDETVTITATADDGFVFVGWSGDTTSTVNPIDIYMDANFSIAATFEAISSVSKSDASINSLSNFPNPFTGITNISYELSKTSSIKLTVYNMLGEEIEILVNKVQDAGKYKIQWDASKNTSGMYIYVLENDSHTSINRMILNR